MPAVLEKPLTLEIPEPPDVILDPYNERVKIYGVPPSSLDLSIVDEAEASKVTIYAPPGAESDWRELGFKKEAVIRGFFEEQDAHLWATYQEPERAVSEREEAHRAGVKLALSKPILDQVELPGGYTCQVADPAESPEIAALMGNTFEDYPSPITPEVIEAQIVEQANHFRVVRDRSGSVAAVASAEMDHARASAEMTDCATRPDHRGRGLMGYLLQEIAEDIALRYGIRDLYTLARADEIGMNCVFRKLGYDFCGRLINNCRMPNGWESMNVWCKSN